MGYFEFIFQLSYSKRGCRFHSLDSQVHRQQPLLTLIRGACLAQRVVRPYRPHPRNVCTTRQTNDCWNIERRNEITSSHQLNFYAVSLLWDLYVALYVGYHDRGHPWRRTETINLGATSAIFDTALMCLSLTQRSFSHQMQCRIERGAVSLPHCPSPLKEIPLERTDSLSIGTLRNHVTFSARLLPYSPFRSPPHFWPQARWWCHWAGWWRRRRAVGRFSRYRLNITIKMI